MSESKETKVYKKRPHRKVKSGCSTCKRRKIKCDEEKPTCSNCARYNAECIYPSSSSDAQREQTSYSASATPPLVNTPESIVEEPPIPQFPKGCHDLPMRDLALMHQWCTSTCFGFGDEFPGAADPWRVDVPILAQQNPFLMRGILAVTALHISRLTTDQSVKYKYIQLAAYHQDLALPEYRAAIIDVTEQNVSAVLAFSALTTVYSFAAPKDAGSVFAAGAQGWIFLHRGVGDIPPHWQNWIDRGPLRLQMHRRRLQPIDPAYNPDDFRLLSLHGMFDNLPPDELSDIPHYEGALYWLRQAFAHTFYPESQLGSKYAVLYWIEHVPSGYLELLHSQKPCAGVLLAHCCILLKRASNFWYLEGFAEHMINELKPSLTSGYMPWMQWPLQACGLL